MLRGLAHNYSYFCGICNDLAIGKETYTSCAACTILGGGCCTACEQLVLLDKKIKDTFNVLQQLQSAAFELKSQRNCQHDRLVNHLPTELLARVFMHFLPHIPAPAVSTFFSPLTIKAEEYRLGAHGSRWTLSMVCRAWRNVIRATPQMWTSIAVNMERSDAGYPEFINSQFLRSGGLPLSVEVFSYPPPYRSLENPPVMRLFEIVNAHSDRWNCLETCLRPGILQYLHGNPETCTSPLEHILVKRYGSSSAYRVRDEFGMLNSNPSPTTVHLGDLSFGSIRISWHRVTHVEISSLSFDLDSYLALFASAQVMTHLTVQKLWFPHDALTSTPAVPIEHTALRALKIYECGLALNPLLRALKLPCLEEIFIDYDYFAPLTDLITRSNCHLKRLTLAMSRNSNMPEDAEIDLLRLLEHTPSLVALMIQDFRHTNLLVDRLEPHSRGGSPTFPDAFTHEPELLPLLRTLVIRVSRGLEWHSICVPNWVPAPVVEL